MPCSALMDIMGVYSADLYGEDGELPGRERRHKSCQALSSLKAYKYESTSAASHDFHYGWCLW